MDKDTMVSAEAREETGTGAARKLRSKGWVPAIINDVDGNTRPIKVNKHDFELLLHRHSGESLLLDVKIGKEKALKTILKEVQHDPISGDVLHADFKEIVMTEKLRLTIPIELAGDPPGVEAGGNMEHLIRDLEVECLPTDIVESIVVDVSQLNIGDTVTVGDLDIDPKLSVITSESIAVVSVAAPRVEEEKEEEEEVEEGAEPEVIGEKERQETEKEEESGQTA